VPPHHPQKQFFWHWGIKLPIWLFFPKLLVVWVSILGNFYMLLSQNGVLCSLGFMCSFPAIFPHFAVFVLLLFGEDFKFPRLLIFLHAVWGCVFLWCAFQLFSVIMHACVLTVVC
jgi:hypothetical protein